MEGLSEQHTVPVVDFWPCSSLRAVLGMCSFVFDRFRFHPFFRGMPISPKIGARSSAFVCIGLSANKGVNKGGSFEEGLAREALKPQDSYRKVPLLRGLIQILPKFGNSRHGVMGSDPPKKRKRQGGGGKGGGELAGHSERGPSAAAAHGLPGRLHYGRGLRPAGAPARPEARRNAGGRRPKEKKRRKSPKGFPHPGIKNT